MENPRLFFKRASYNDDWVDTTLRDPDNSIIGRQNDSEDDNYVTICMLCQLDVRNADHVKGAEHQKKFGFGDKLLGAGGEVATSCAQEAA